MMEQENGGEDRIGSPQLLGEGEPDLFSSLLNETSQTTIEETRVYTFDILNAKLHEFTSHLDEVAIQRHSNYLAKLQVLLLLHIQTSTLLLRTCVLSAYIHTCIHLARTYVRIYSHGMCTRMCAYVQMHTFIHTYKRCIYVYAYICKYIHTYPNPIVHTSTH